MDHRYCKSSINKKSSSVVFIVLVCIAIGFAQSGNTLGLIMNEPGTYEGYTLIIPKNYTSTYLINNEGLLVNKWDSEYLPAMSAYLLEDGNLMRSAKVPQEGSTRTGGFELLDWEGNVLWVYHAGRQHHDIEPLPNGNVLLILTDARSTSEAIDAGRNPGLVSTNGVRSLRIVEVEQAGQDGGTIVWEWNLWDHLIQEFDVNKDNYDTVADHPELIDLNYGASNNPNWIHINSIDYNPGFDQI
ncbi:MAG: aryl-sulfate sulfotransferase, partial [Candidatus Neomarinimicrobiota bacterium]